jgi:NADPH-dependent glutamate synthase beta subunit-like oxidoreductase
MKEQEPEERIKNFKEVPLGYSDQESIKEAERCLQCEKVCVMGIKNKPIVIGHLERYVADYNIKKGTDKSSVAELEKMKIPELEGKKIAVVGAGNVAMDSARTANGSRRCISSLQKSFRADAGQK